MSPGNFARRIVRYLRLCLLVTLPLVAGSGAAQPQRPQSILFIGNSFTHGAHSAMRNWRASTVDDLNDAGYGGVPALFKAFTTQQKLEYAVALETQGGQSLGFHYDQRRHLFTRGWDVVVLQEYSTLDRERPGDPSAYYRNVQRLAELFRSANPKVRIYLAATWGRPDLVYKTPSRWNGRPIDTMAMDLRRAADAAAKRIGAAGVIPIGEAFNRAIAANIADPNPYDGIGSGQLSLWAYDHYHGSIAGYYLKGLCVFTKVTAASAVSLGKAEPAADELGLSDDQAGDLQRIAAETCT